MGRDPDFATFINGTLGSRLMPQMAREKSGDDEVSIAFFFPFSLYEKNTRTRFTCLYLAQNLHVVFLFVIKRS